MKSRSLILSAVLIILFNMASYVHTTPSTIIWIPSVDLQPYKSCHLGIDNYSLDFKKGVTGSGIAFPTDLGLTAGILPFSTIQVEVGVDYFTPQLSPLTMNAKVGVLEGAFTEWSPAVAIGGFGFGFQKNVTDYNVLYGIAGKTFPVIGRIEAGFYTGNSALLVNLSTGKADDTGILISWDRQMMEISENLWLAIDYQSGNNNLGAFSYGFAWAFSKNISVIFARDIFNADIPSALSMQLDINI
jgi:hypothetical protein